MKIFCIALCLAVFLAVEGKRCSGPDDCEADQCCIARSILGFVKGDCKKLASKGDRCSVEDDRLPFHGEKYILFCPCGNGLSCEPTEVKDIPFIGTIRLDERCTEGVTTAPPPEASTKPEEPEPEPDTE
ncbi:U1-hexatoxin-Iw1c [Parasteatoda tepidariorum]|uniref:U1-hexatoxin-Iw1c n=1 Tax=Parasteatoda tepidariorum TaxID=114398 RepID=UPI00077FB612|nr:U3-aranetoxin-Ce1a [Parasteatoda tepidariorum]